MTTNRCPHEDEHTVDLSPTAHLLEELQLFGHRPLEDEPDSREIAAWERQATPQAHASLDVHNRESSRQNGRALPSPSQFPSPNPKSHNSCAAVLDDRFLETHHIGGDVKIF